MRLQRRMALQTMNRFGYAKDPDDAYVTVIQNAFINHYMLKARGDYVKVYLYGLKLCSSAKPPFPSNAQIAATLDMTEHDVISAWKYWEEQGIIYINTDYGEVEIEYRNLASAILTGTLNKPKPKAELSTRSREMILDIEEKLNAPLNANDALEIQEWVDRYNLSPETIVLLASDSIDRGKLSIRYWRVIAESFRKQGISRYDEAVSFINERDAFNKNLKEVLNCLGQYRNPTAKERSLYEKWRSEYSFSHEDIMKGCEQAYHPTFASLDSVLSAVFKGEEPAKSAKRLPRSQQRPKMENDFDYDIDWVDEKLFGEK